LACSFALFLRFKFCQETQAISYNLRLEKEQNYYANSVHFISLQFLSGINHCKITDCFINPIGIINLMYKNTILIPHYLGNPQSIYHSFSFDRHRGKVYHEITFYKISFISGYNINIYNRFIGIIFFFIIKDFYAP